jgi:hypothetical protein
MARSTRALASSQLNQRGLEGYPGVRKTSCPWRSTLKPGMYMRGRICIPRPSQNSRGSTWGTGR